MVRALLLAVLLTAGAAGALAQAQPGASIVAFNNEAQAAVREYGIPSQISSRVRRELADGAGQQDGLSGSAGDARMLQRSGGGGAAIRGTWRHARACRVAIALQLACAVCKRGPPVQPGGAAQFLHGAALRALPTHTLAPADLRDSAHGAIRRHQPAPRPRRASRLRRCVPPKCASPLPCLPCMPWPCSVQQLAGGWMVGLHCCGGPAERAGAGGAASTAIAGTARGACMHCRLACMRCLPPCMHQHGACMCLVVTLPPPPPAPAAWAGHTALNTLFPWRWGALDKALAPFLAGLTPQEARTAQSAGRAAGLSIVATV